MLKTIVFLLILFSVGIIGIAINANEYLSEENFLPCPNPEDFHCSTGSVCIKSELECDGKKDCPDGSDEFEAECDFKLCKPPKFYTCKDNETCIVQNFRCDGHNDCPSNDDEDNCSDYVPHHEIIECNANEFTCLRDNMCIPMEFVCDGIHHCVDSSDENMGCLNIKKSCKGFLCKNNHCLNDKTWICDGTDDCGDGSDEKNCTSDCTSGNKKFLCGDSVTCIAIENVCDNRKDCRDGLDEGGICNKFHNNTACELNYCPYNAECFIWPTGPVCVCPQGFSYNPQKKTCEDIDECQTYGICSQGCVNSPGSYKCTCEKRFRLKGDKKTCESISHTEPVLLYAGKTSINMVYLRSNHQSVVTEKVRQVIGVSYDGHFVYWTNVALNSESIVKAREDGSKLETLLTTGLSLPEDIAIDWITGNLYFSDAMYMHIAVCSNDGKHCTSLITDKVERPRSIALYPQEGRMYWSEWGTEPMIAVAHMDGSFAAPFIRENIHWPSGVTLDWPNNRLYWVDAKVKKIESCNLDGTGRRTVIDQVLKHPYGLAVFENNIYWSDWSAMSIETCNKFSCKDKKVIVRDRKVYDIHIYHNSIQPITKNPCKNNQCSHLCMLASNSSFTCGCPTGMALDVDQLSCSATIKKESIYIGLRNYLIMMEHETFGRHQIEKAKVVPMYIHKMAFNLLNGHVFIADNIARIIYDYDLVEEKAIELISTNVGIVTSMSFDHLSNNLYWADSEHGTVEIYSMNTKHRAIVHQYFPAKPIGIAVVPENGHMFVASRTYFGHTHIDIQSLHGGGDHHHIIESQLGDKLIEFAIDRQVKEVYFCDSEMHQISWTDLTGESLHVFKEVPAEPISIAVLSEDVFWTSNKSHDVFWTPKHSPDTTKQLVLPHHDYVTNDDRPVLVGVMPTVVSSHPCTIDNGGCSHICATYDSKQHVCLCPPGMVFSDYRNNTCMEAIDCEFRCGSGECITASRQCNNFKDCADGSDERDCISHKNMEVKCYRDEFKCLDGKQCVAIELRCDKINDCTDKSDERDCIGYNTTTKCHENQFRCTDGLCIDLTVVCDGSNDCEDGLDELKCHDKKAMKNVCKSNMFTCANGQCIPAKWVCDEFPDCRDGSDEHHCPEKVCPEGFLQCKHGRCVHLDLVCDGFNNCGDYTDELNCTNVPAPATCEKFNSNNEPLQFQCVSDKTICLNITARCNGTAECPRGEDEANCTGCRINEFECANKKCIRQEWRCDKQNDCGDRSDEIGCVNEPVVTNKTNIGCGPGMFSCRDGNCIYIELVCNGQNDCPNGMDESSACNSSCLNHPCQHMCHPSPFGAVCSCREGFKLGGDGRSCFDINECKLYDPCAQKCENTLGSYRCSCYTGYMLKSDKVTCKSISGHAHILYSSMNLIYDINLASLGVLWSSNGSRIAGMDVNMRKNLLYFTVEDSNALYEMNLDNKKVVYVTNIGNPHHIAVEWVTDNVYFFDQDTNPSIKVCHMDRQVCTRIITLKYRDVVKSLVVDSTNDKIFYSIVHPLYSSADSFIYSHSLDGSREKIIVKGSGHISGLTNDVNKQILYYADLSTSSLWSVRNDGTDRKEILKKSPFITRPSDLSFYEDHLMILNTGTKTVAVCRTYGDRKCSSFEFSSYNSENLVVAQESRQREKPNNCLGYNCSLICVPAELGPKCICHGGVPEVDGRCNEMSNDVAISPRFNTLTSTSTKTKTSSNHPLLATIFSVLGILVGSAIVSMSVFYVYQKYFHLHKKFNISMHFENPASNNIDNAQVKMCRPPPPQLTTTSSNYYNEIYVNNQEPIGPIVEEYDVNLTTDSDTAQLIY